jgi:pimeloyl-ACP methyl ester carboxylesterase
MTTPPPEKVVHLNRYYHFTELMRDPAIEVRLLRYQSAHDGTRQTVFVLQPATQKSDKLFFFFHGMDGDCGDGVVVRDIVKRLNATVVTMGGRGPAWISTAFLADADQVIRDYAGRFNDYFLIGVSMGGTQALALAGLLPDDLRRSIAGVIALIPGVNLPALVARSSNERVRNTVRDSVTGDMSQLQDRSPIEVMSRYKARLPFVIFLNQQDTLLLTDELEKFIASLRRNGHPVTTISVPGDHNFTYEKFDFREAIGRLGRDSSENGAPLRPDGT